MNMARQGFNLQTLVGIQLDNIAQIIDILQGIDSARHGAPTNMTPSVDTQPPENKQEAEPMPTTAVKAGVIQWEWVGNNQVPPTAGTHPPPIIMGKGGRIPRSSTIQRLVVRPIRLIHPLVGSVS